MKLTRDEIEFPDCLHIANGVDRDYNIHPSPTAWNDLARRHGYSLTFHPDTAVHHVEAIRRKLDSSGKGIYVLLAPSGYGKSTLTEDLYWRGCGILQKVSTRPPRPKKTHPPIKLKDLIETDSEEVIITPPPRDKEIQAINRKFFRYALKTRQLVIPHKYKGHNYAIPRRALREARVKSEPYVYPTTDAQSAFRLRRMLPDEVKVVILAPPLDFAGFGLEQRINFDPTARTLPIGDVKKVIAQAQDTQKRLDRIVKDARQMQQFRADADLVVESTDLHQAVHEILDFIYQ